MAPLFMDSFDHYVTADAGKKYPLGTSGRIHATYGRRSSGCMRGEGNVLSSTVGAGPATTDTMIVGYARKSAESHDEMLRISNADGFQVSIISQTDGTIIAYRYRWYSQEDAALEIGRTAAATITANTWQYVEFKIKIHGSAGTVHLQVNGVSVLAVTGANTMPSGVATATSVQVRSSPGGYIDDLYVLDTSGSVNNDFLGDVRVDAHYPVTPDGTNHAWAPSTGSDNFAVVDEAAPNISDYNSTITLNDVDTFNLEAFKNTGARIIGAQLSLFHSKEDAGSCLVAPVVRTHATEYVGSDFAPSESSYTYKTTPYEVNPYTGLAWSEEDLNAVEVGYKKTG